MSMNPLGTVLWKAFAACVERTREPAWLTQQRNAAMARFVELGLPDRKSEAWRFSDLRPLTANLVQPATVADGVVEPTHIAPHRLAGETHRIVLVNGRVQPDLCALGTLPRGVWLGSLTDMIDLRPDLMTPERLAADTVGAQPFAPLNSAMFTDGFVLALDPGVVLTHPVEIIHLNRTPEPRSYHCRNMILAGDCSAVTVVETYAGSGAGWTNVVTTVDVATGASLRHVKVQAEAADAIHISLTRARLATAAHYEAFALITGARLSRQDIQVVMEGTAARLTLNGAWLLRGQQEATLAPAVDHQARDGETQELLKGVLADQAHGVFLGSVLVREGADGTNARQLNRNLLTSPTARIDTKPELTIHADEVRCGHGATVGDLDEAALFYLMARGIPPHTARHMLIEAFAAEVLDVACLPPSIDAHLRHYLDAWLTQEGAAS